VTPPVTVAESIGRALVDGGVRSLFGVPGGGSNLDLVAAAEGAGVPFVLTSTEAGAALAAIAQAEITGHPGACLTTLGPGATSVVNGVACAWLDRVPLLVFTDSHPMSAAAFDHQRIDQAALFASITKRSVQLSAATAATTVREAMCSATTGRPGPVHLECPGDVAARPATGVSTIDGGTRTSVDVAIDDERCGPEFEALVSKARKPIIIVGLGASRDEHADAITSLCARRRVPALVTYKAKGIVPDTHGWFAGVFTNAAIERPMVAESDLIIGLGLDPIELIPREWSYTQPVVYCGPWAVDDEYLPFAASRVVDVGRGVEWLDSLITTSDWDVTQVATRRLAQQAQLRIAAPGLTADRVVDVAAERLASVASRVTVDAGAHMFPATSLWPIDTPRGMLISNGLSTMGFAVPAAIGASLVDRGTLTVALTGDGGLLMCLGELATIAREQLRVIVIVFNDRSLSLIDIKQQARRLERRGVALGDLDWLAIAHGFGIPAFAAGDEGQLRGAIDRALECDGPALIDVRIDGSTYGAMLKAVRG
jgi:acetolactate synthase-1/2/3 large subunit